MSKEVGALYFNLTMPRPAPSVPGRVNAFETT